MSNPFQITTLNRGVYSKRQLPAFWIGARNGFLWSLLLAIPAGFIFYEESMLGVANAFDPVTFARTQVTVTNSHRIAAGTEAIVNALLYIVLPWSVIAGLVRLVSSKASGVSLVNGASFRESGVTKSSLDSEI